MSRSFSQYFSQACPMTSAQAVSGTLVGTITDSESLPIPGATVTITEVNTNIKTTAVTNETATSCSRASGTASIASKRS